jgi:hypothetical protein
VPIQPARYLSFLEEKEGKERREKGKGLKKRMFGGGI